MLRRSLIFFSGLFCFFVSFAQIPAGYYNNAANKTGETLRGALRDIVTAGSVKMPYTSSSFDIWDAYGQTDVRPGTNTIWDMYSDVPGGTPQYTYTLYTNQCGTAGAEGDCYAREHQVPNSWWGGFDDASNPQYTDLHHLPPADQYVNNFKSAHPIGKVGTATFTSSNGSKVGSCSWPGYTGVVFEPIDEYKGDFARAYLYVATRYMNRLSAWVTSYPGTEAQFVINSTGNNYKQWFIDMLVQWTLLDPVSQKEIDRNDAIYYSTPQHNRNPYIDHPEYVCLVWSSTSCVSGPVISAVSQSPLVATSTTAVNITATVSSSNGVTGVTVEWGTNGTTFPNSINTIQTPSTNDFVTETPIPAQVAGTTVYYRIIAEDNSGNITTSSVRNYSVLKDEPTNYPSSFAAVIATGSSITLTWTDATGGTVPDGYLIKAGSVSLASITNPSDSVTQTNGSFVKNVAAGVQQVVFSGLGSSTIYYFKIFPYTNSGTNINYKTSGTPPNTSDTTLAVSGGSSCATDLIISEYVEGNSNNKYIEIYNNTGAAVNLSDYKLRLFANGATTATSDVALSGTLNNLSSIVYKNGSALPYTGTATTNAAVNFNGDDAVALYKISTASYVDIFGRIGEDPGTNWADGSTVTVDKTLVRNSNVYSGVSVNPTSGFPTLASEWTQFNIDDVSNLGTHTMNCPACAVPSQNSSSVVYSNVGETSMTISWTKGDGARRILVMKEGSAVSGSPETGITYSANTVFGSGDTLGFGEFVMFNGTGNSVSVTNLIAGRTYHISIFEYNCLPGAQLFLTPGFSSSRVTYSITTGSASEASYCVTSAAGASASVDYSSTGTFSSNTFSVQLSDSAGSFAAPVTIGSLSSNAGSGTINCTIPAGTPSGSGYRMRVSSSNPVVTGTSGGAFEIILSPIAVAPASLSSDRSGFCSSDSGNITLTATGGSGTELSWFSGSCGGAYLGSGNPLVIPSPSATTTYYASWGTTCSNSVCASVTVAVSGLPSATAGAAIASCNGTTSISMSGATNSVITNNWSGGESLGSWTQNANPSLASFAPSQPAGSFIATLTVFSSGSCPGISATYTRKISWGSNGSWTGASNSEWTNSANWCGGVPASTRDVYIPPVSHVLNSPVITASGAICQSMSLSGNLSFSSIGTLDVYGNWNTNGGDISATSGTITLLGFAKTISGTVPADFPAIRLNPGASYTMNNSNSFSSLTLVRGSSPSSLSLSSGISLSVAGDAVVNQLSSGSGTNNLTIGSASVVINGNLTIGSGSSNSNRIARVSLTTGTLTIGGNLTFNTPTTSCAVLDLSGGASTVNLAGSFTRTTTGTLTPGTQSTFNYNGSGASQTVLFGTGISYSNLHLNNTNPSGAVLGAAISATNVTGNVLIQSGMLANGGFSVAGNSARQFSVGAGCMYRLSSATSMPSGFGTLLIGSNSTVEFSGSSSQTIAALNYANLTSSGSGARTFASSGTIGISGSFTPGTNTYTTTGSTINFNGSNQIIPEITAANGYNNVSVSQTSGAGILSGNVRIGGTLSLVSGNLNVGAGNLILAGSAAVSGSPFSSSKMIVADGGGEVRKIFTANGSYLFPLGDNSGTAEYSPVTVNFSSGTYGTGAYVSAKVINQKHPQNTNANNYLNRYWTIGTSGITNPNYSVTSTYVSDDIIGSDNSIFMARYSGSLPWIFYSAANTSAKTLTASSLSVTGSSDYSGISSNAIAVSIQGGATSICTGDSVQLTAVPSGSGPFTYLWSPSSGVSDVNVANPKVSPAATTAYTVTITDDFGSTAVAGTTITVNPRPVAAITQGGSASICAGGSVTLTASSGASYLWSTGSTSQSISASSAGNYFVQVTSANGCSDVSDTVTVTVRNTSSGSETLTVCSSALPVQWNGLTVSSAGTSQVVLTNSVGCDSVVTLNLIVLNEGIFTDTVSSCNSYVLPWGVTVNVTGTYSNTYPAASFNGCDSIASVHVIINSATNQTSNVSSCGSYTWNSVTYTQSGTYSYSYTNAAGCASVDTLKLVINQGTFNVTTSVSCDSLIWNGVTYRSSGIYTRSYVNASGCASVDTLKLTINNGTRQTSIISECGSYTWPSNGQIYTQSGIYFNNYTNAAGCASFDTLKLTVVNNTIANVSDSACNSYTWSLNGNTYTQSGNYTYTAAPAASSGGGVKISQVYGGGGGSTGTYIRDYVELYNSSCLLTDISNWALEYGAATGNWGSSSGNIFTFPPGTAIPPKKYLLVQCGAAGTAGAALPVTPDFSTATSGFSMSATSGKVALFTAVNSNLACGSELAGTLVDKVSYGSANCAEGTVKTGLTATTVLVRKNGGETDSDNNSNDFDVVSASGISLRNSSSVANASNPCPTCSTTVLQLKITPSVTITDSVSACESYTWPVNNTTYTQSGNYNFVSGCTTRILKLNIRTGTRNSTSVNACGSYLWNGTTYTQSGTYTNSYINNAGCPSADTLKLSIASLPDAGDIQGDAAICAGSVKTYVSTGNAGGSWVSGDTSVLQVNGSGQVTALSAASASLMYIVTSPLCGSDTASFSVNVNNCNITVSLKAFIQGYYSGGGLMVPALLNSNVPGATSSQTDTVTVEIRNGVNGSLLAGPVSAVLQTNGTASAVFTAVSGSHYIVIRHRNAVEIWSAAPVAFSTAVNYDFSDADSKAFGSNQVMVAPGIYAMWSGDVNQDGSVESFDYTEMENSVLSILFGYYPADLTGDGVVESDDYVLMELNVNRIIFALTPF